MASARAALHLASRAATAASAREGGSRPAHAIAELARSQPDLGRRLHGDLPAIGAEVVWAARREMARTVEDVLARRTRALFLNARAALAMAPQVAGLLARELGYGRHWEDEQVQAFEEVAQGYVVS